MSGGPIQSHRDGVIIDLYVQPRASRTEPAGIHDGALRLRVAAPPVDGAANEAIVTFLSRTLGVRKADIAIVSGATGRRKRVTVSGIGAETAYARLFDSLPP